MDQYIGKLLDNRYEIMEQIGLGGMARVFRARDHRLNRLVAVKVLKEDLAQDEEFRRRFHDESRAVAMLSHPNIVAVYDVSRSSDLEYIVMELIDGITLKQYMQKKGNKLNWREALHFITQIVKALGHAHSRGIIHRDIKPHNIMVLRDGSVKVADFGIARLTNAAHSTLTQEALGSVHYISPEQARGSHIDARSDLYSAGVVLYEMLTGRLPFEGDSPVSVAIQHINSIPLTPREINPEIPEALEAITMKAMAPNPDNRYASADEMLADLEEFRKNPNINFDYTMDDLFRDGGNEEPTQIITGAGSGSGRRRREMEKRFPEDEDDLEEEAEEEAGYRRRRDRRERRINYPFVAAVGGVLLFVVVLFYFLWSFLLAPLMAEEPVYVVPNVTGHTLEEFAFDPSLLNGFTLVEGEVVESDQTAGTIVDQEPKADREIIGDEDLTIVVTISSGPEEIVMPEVYNKEYRTVRLELEGMGLVVLPEIREYSDDISYGYVTRYTPAAGTVLSEGDEVQLWVSDGADTPTVEVPNLYNETLERATSDLDMMNLGVGSTSEVYDSEVPAGSVVSQYPAAGESVPEGTKVNLQISKGPDPANTPQPATVPYLVNLPDIEGYVTVRITVGGVTVYEESVDCTMNDYIEPDITGTGTQTVSVYFDGVLYEARDYNFSG